MNMYLLRHIVQHVDLLQRLLGFGQPDALQSAVTVSEQWLVLGPFTSGTREATWGADPLEAIGGFYSLTYNKSSHYGSSLAVNGTVAWTDVIAQVTCLDDDAVHVELQVAFPDIDWTFLQQVYGWAALQWQGWARGYITVGGNDTRSYNLNVDRILELRIDDEHYFGGDFYSFHKAPLLLQLDPGRHKVDVRLIRDVRSMGGITSSPAVNVRLLLTRTTKSLRQNGEVLFPDRLVGWRGPLSSTYASVILRNDNNTDVFIYSLSTSSKTCPARLMNAVPIRLVPGQSRPIAFQIDCIPGASAQLSIDLRFSYYVEANGKIQHELLVAMPAQPPQSLTGPHVITYPLPAGIVSYAVLRPPPLSCLGDKLPVIVALHGAGVAVDSDQSKHTFDEMADLCAWILLPSGVTAWSGDDWHNWGWADVEAALDAIPAWIDKVEWKGPGVDISRWLVTGHSNGGQGVWYAVTHHPDQLTAAAAVSGYSSIQNYVPYTFWQQSDPARTAVVQAQLSSYRHELLLDNAKGVQLFQQHGSLDDNVPAYHSRLMYDLVHQSSAHSTYLEVEGKPHWWDGVMTTPALKHFYKQHLTGNSTLPHTSQIIGNFSVVTANPGDTGGKNGLTILSLSTPGQLGRVHVIFAYEQALQCHIRTENVDSLELKGGQLRECNGFHVDGTSIVLSLADGAILDKVSGTWTIRHAGAPHSCTRAKQQYGGLEAILRTTGTFQIVSHSPKTRDITTRIANNLVQYFSADVEIATTYTDALNAKGNIISLRYGSDLHPVPRYCEQTCRVDLDDHGQLVIAVGDSVLHSFDIIHNEIVAAAFLRPLPDQRLELVFWAVDQASLNVSTRLLPLLTGGGQPDFVVATRQMLARGLEGVFAMGFFNSSWCPATTSFFSTGTKL